MLIFITPLSDLLPVLNGWQWHVAHLMHLCLNILQKSDCRLPDCNNKLSCRLQTWYTHLLYAITSVFFFFKKKSKIIWNCMQLLPKLIQMGKKCGYTNIYCMAEMFRNKLDCLEQDRWVRLTLNKKWNNNETECFLYCKIW